MCGCPGLGTIPGLVLRPAVPYLVASHGWGGSPSLQNIPKKTEWKTEKPEPKEEEDRYIARDNSVDDMIAQVLNKK